MKCAPFLIDCNLVADTVRRYYCIFISVHGSSIHFVASKTTVKEICEYILIFKAFEGFLNCFCSTDFEGFLHLFVCLLKYSVINYSTFMCTLI